MSSLLLASALLRRGKRWESICRRCGACCYEKQTRGRTVTVDWRRPCRFLNVSSRLCTVYGERFQRCPECRPMTLRHALFTPWLPDGCGYVARFRRRRRVRPCTPPP